MSAPRASAAAKKELRKKRGGEERSAAKSCYLSVATFFQPCAHRKPREREFREGGGKREAAIQSDLSSAG